MTLSVVEGEESLYFVFAFVVVCSFTHPQKNIVISTEAVHGLIMNSAVEKPPYFVFVLSVLHLTPLQVSEASAHSKKSNAPAVSRGV
ncbi:hypothetical protein RBB73_09070 [Tunturiibacter empetritectus]|uniref:hypothetical protein n=1 Tax=Tunturiibacter empetritectus TaxID=3069691 RepID=UPI003D9B4BC2